MKGFIKSKLQDYEIWRIEKNYEKAIKKSMLLCPMTPLSKGQVADIKSYFIKHFGREIPTYWHQYLYSRNGVYSEKYIPASIYNSEIIYRLNKFQFRHAYVDKGFYDTLFPDINRPKTIVKNVNGYYYDDSNPLTLEEAVERCANLDGAIIKPTLEGTWGQGVKLIQTENGVVSGQIPFDIVPPKYNFSEETLAAIDEARRISKDPSVKSYTSAKELFEDCE